MGLHVIRIPHREPVAFGQVLGHLIPRTTVRIDLCAARNLLEQRPEPLVVDRVAGIGIASAKCTRSHEQLSFAHLSLGHHNPALGVFDEGLPIGRSLERDHLRRIAGDLFILENAIPRQRFLGRHIGKLGIESSQQSVEMVSLLLAKQGIVAQHNHTAAPDEKAPYCFNIFGPYNGTATQMTEESRDLRW